MEFILTPIVFFWGFFFGFFVFCFVLFFVFYKMNARMSLVFQSMVHDITYVGNSAWAHLCAIRALQESPQQVAGINTYEIKARINLLSGKGSVNRPD